MSKPANETLSRDNFVSQMRAFAARCNATCDGLSIDRYPDAIAIEDASEDELRMVQFLHRYTTAGLEMQLQAYETDFFAYVLGAVAAKITIRLSK